MKVLFVSSGNKRTGISQVVYNQGESIRRLGVDLTYFKIEGKGLFGYLRSLRMLRRYLNLNHFSVIHSHYSLSGIVAALAGAKPLVASLMGSDVKQNFLGRLMIKIFYRFQWDSCIVKTDDMKASLGINDINVLPNGVDLNHFSVITKETAQKKLAWDVHKKHILFVADPVRKVKNFALAKQAFDLAGIKGEMHFLIDITREELPLHYNASDVVLLTSLWEGSPNVIKEAMACNCPIVSTDVGDVKWIIGNTEGCYITGFNAEDISEKITNALEFGKRTVGRDRIKNLGLDSDSVADKILKIYSSLLN